MDGTRSVYKSLPMLTRLAYSKQKSKKPLTATGQIRYITHWTPVTTGSGNHVISNAIVTQQSCSDSDVDVDVEADADAPQDPPLDYLSDVVGRIQQGQNGKSGVAVPQDDSERWLHYREKALAKYKELTGLYPDHAVGTPAISELAAQPDFDLARWEASITSCRLAGVKPGNISCMIDTYKAGGDYRAQYRKGDSRATQPPNEMPHPSGKGKILIVQ